MAKPPTSHGVPSLSSINMPLGLRERGTAIALAGVPAPSRTPLIQGHLAESGTHIRRSIGLREASLRGGVAQ